MTLDRRATDPLTVTDDEPASAYLTDREALGSAWSVLVHAEQVIPHDLVEWAEVATQVRYIQRHLRRPRRERPRAVRQRRILAAVSTGAVLYGAHVSVWAIPMLLGALAAAALFLVWQPQDRLRRLVEAWR